MYILRPAFSFHFHDVSLVKAIHGITRRPHHTLRFPEVSLFYDFFSCAAEEQPAGSPTVERVAARFPFSTFVVSFSGISHPAGIIARQGIPRR
jgi:hypothetical protein